MHDSVIVLEFNELTPRLMDQFIREGHLPNFAKLRAESTVCVSDPEEEAPALEPWIQWVTVHTGLSYSEHGVFHLSDGPKLDAPRVWDMVSEAGKDVWVCGSMNATVHGPSIRGLVLPDPWAVSVRPHPEDLFRPYYHLVRSYVQEYTRDKPPVTKADLLRFARFMVTHGLSAKTVVDTLRQLARERDGKSRWQRAAILDRLQWDLFRHFYRKTNPALATFFLNSTAHYQHYYWRNMDPHSFELKPSATDQERYADAILFGYRKMDEIVGECLKLAGPDTTIVLCSALGQQPLLKYEAAGGKQLFKPVDPMALVRFAGISDKCEYAPVMAEEFYLYFKDATAAEEATRKLLALRMGDGAPVIRAEPDGVRVFAACVVTAMPAADATVVSAGSNKATRFGELFYAVEGIKSGGHHPDGILWVRTPDRTHRQVLRKVSLREVAPTLLGLCGVDAQGRFSHAAMPEVTGSPSLDGGPSQAAAEPGRPDRLVRA